MKKTPSLYSITFLTILATSAHCASIIIDDPDGGYEDHNAGTMFAATPAFGAKLFNDAAQTSLVVLQNAPDSFVSWTFTGLDPAKNYDVAATWNTVNGWASGNHNTDANYTIIGGSTVIQTLNHSVAATDDYVEDDSFQVSHNFQTIGQVKPNSSGTIILELRDEDGNGILGVVADAALVSEVPVPEPSSSALLCLGGIALALRRRK